MDEAGFGRVRVVVMLYGHLGWRQGVYLHRQVISRYLGRLAEECGPMTLIARVKEVTADELRLRSPLPSGAIDIRPLRTSCGPFAGTRILWSAFRELHRALSTSRGSDERPVVFAFAPGPVALGAALARKLGRFPLTVYFGIDWEGMEAEGGGWFGRLKRWRNRTLQRFIARSAEAAICAGEALLAKIGRDCRACHRTVPILDLPRPVSRDGAERSGSKPVPGGPSAPFCFLYVGTLSPRKGVMNLVAAVARLRAENYAIRLHVVGDGPERGRLEAAIRVLSVNDVVELHGYVSDREELFAYYAASHAFVLPSYNEGFPRVLYEASAASLPIVATTVGGIPAVMEDGKHALLVPPGDVDSLCVAMRALVDEPGLGRELARRNAGLLVGEESDAAEQHATVLRSVIGEWYA